MSGATLSVSGVALLVAALMLLASAAKALYPSHARVDRAVAVLSALVVSLFFTQRAMIAAAKGDLTLLRFGQYFMAGGICAFLTHAACTPIDVVKTRIQTTSGKYRGMFDAFRKIVGDEGPATLLKGLGATAGGYFLHGAFKYSFYEVFKMLLSPNAAAALNPPFSVAALAGFFAECIACTLLCPMEAIRIRSVADTGFPTGVLTGLRVLFAMEGLHGLYKGLPAMLLKQVPYTVGQFVSFELSLSFVKLVFRFFGGHSSKSTAAFISFMAGLLAGITAAVISHPGDTILSKVNQEQGEGSSTQQIWRVARLEGLRGLFLGLIPRLVQVSCMVGAQFLIYDSIKLWVGIIPASAIPEAIAQVTTKVVPVSGAGAAGVAAAAMKRKRR